MYPYSTNNPDKGLTPENSESDECIDSSEAIQGDEAIISTINELNDLRNAET